MRGPTAEPFFDGGAAQRHSPVLRCSRATKALLIGSFLTSRKPSIRFRGIQALMAGHPTSDVAACCVALCGACASHPLASVAHKHFAFQTCGVMPTVGRYLIAWDLCCTGPVRGRFPSNPFQLFRDRPWTPKSPELPSRLRSTTATPTRTTTWRRMAFCCSVVAVCCRAQLTHSCWNMASVERTLVSGSCQML